MESEERKRWLASLQVGDEVCYRNRWSGYHITEIKKITPTMQIKTSNGYTFKEGIYRFDSWERIMLEPVTDDVRRHILYGKLLTRARNFEYSKCGLEQLEKVASIIDEVEGRVSRASATVATE